MSTLKKGQLVTIGGKYSKVLGYSHLEGTLGVVVRLRTALAEVFILSSGNTVDVHIEDCLLESIEDEDQFFIVDVQTGRIYHTRNEDLYLFSVDLLRSTKHQYELLYTTKFKITEIIDVCSLYFRPFQEIFGYEFTLHSLDQPLDPYAEEIRNAYEHYLTI